jgi:signal recognition particle subunit SRP19
MTNPGRRLPKSLCIDNPNLEELTRSVCMCELRNIIEPHKAYSRDYFQMGRLKIELYRENGTPIHAHIPNSIF